MESSPWSSISNLQQQICDQVLQDHFSTENNYIYRQILYFRAPSTLRKGTDGEYEQHPPWTLMSYSWYRYRNNIWGKHCRMCPLGSGTETSGCRSKLVVPLSKGAGCSLGTRLVPGKWHVCEGQLQVSVCKAAQGLFFPKSRVLVSWSSHRHTPESLKPWLAV